MKLVFSDENRAVVYHARNLVEQAGIEVFLKNEYSAGVIGELSPFDNWLELWVVDDGDRDKANAIIGSFRSSGTAPEWICKHCSEPNGGAFEVCWNCGYEP